MGDTTLKQIKKSVLKPLNEQKDLFLCDLSDTPLKDDMASMEHPIFTISKKPDMTHRHYEHNGNTLDIYPSVWGLATIYDKDILIYAISKLMQAKNQGEPLTKYLVFEAQEALNFMERTDKKGNAAGTRYRALEQSLMRLNGTQLKTNIKTGDKTQTDIFGIIDSATIHREHKDGRVLEWGIKLSDWVFNSILSNEVLTLHRDYFRLRKPIEKRVYELARRHCGNQREWKISIDLLLKKVGSKTTKKEFKRLLKSVVTNDHLPDYHIILDDRGNVIFTRKQQSKVGELSTRKNTSCNTIYSVDSLDQYLDNKAQEKCPKLARDKGIDYYFLKNEFCNFLNSKGAPDNISASFIGFIKQKKIV